MSLTFFQEDNLLKVQIKSRKILNMILNLQLNWINYKENRANNTNFMVNIPDGFDLQYISPDFHKTIAAAIIALKLPNMRLSKKEEENIFIHVHDANEHKHWFEYEESRILRDYPTLLSDGIITQTQCFFCCYLILNNPNGGGPDDDGEPTNKPNQGNIIHPDPSIWRARTTPLKRAA